MSVVESARPLADAAPGERLGHLGPRSAFFGVTALLSLAIVAAFAHAVESWTPFAWAALPLVFINALWIAGGAATALVGLAQPDRKPQTPPTAWLPSGRTAILVTLCGEDPRPLADYLTQLAADLEKRNLKASTRIAVLSDTSGTAKISTEEGALRALIDSGRITYRRRVENTGRKPGNIADWLATHGNAFDALMVLDADSRMTAARMRHMIWQLESRPKIGLLQAGIALVPGRSLFGRHQRNTSRLLSRNFGKGMAAWSGTTGNYWGHNAIMRVAAFQSAAKLPELPGSAPLGGALLSHDFVEAAWIRRAGWDVVLDPDLAGSAEDAPQTLEAFHKRDRRWCQGNLQHLRLLAEPGLHPVSRFNLLSGIFSYIAAPIWLILVVLIGLGAVSVTHAIPLGLVAATLLLPKFCAMAEALSRAQTRWRKRIILRASSAELGLSTILAPLVMVRQSASVASVLVGIDCGWKSGRSRRFSLPTGAGEMAVGLALLALAATSSLGATLWLAPMILPLIGAPLIVRAIDAGA